jgi:geranylgeranyl reductase family protein
MSELNLNPEILVIGAGPGGAAAAWELARSGHDVLMIDKADFPRDKTCGDGLPPMAVQTLNNMSVLDRVLEENPAKVDRVRIRGPFGSQIDVPFSDFMGAGMDYALGLPRLIFDNILRRHAVAKGAEYAGSIRVEKITRDGDRVTTVRAVSPNGPLKFHPRHVVIAVGANMGMLERDGFLRHKTHIMRAARGYYSNVATAPNSYEFFFDLELVPGYGWIFPGGNGISNVGAGTAEIFWSSRHTAQALMQGFVRRRAKQGIMREAVQQEPIKGFPLRVDFPSERVAGENWIIVGEATGLVNPITGEGIDLAMESGLLGARLIHDDIIYRRRNHASYQRELWHRFAPMFNGLRVLRDILITPVLMDYILWKIRQYRFLARTTLGITQGFTSPQMIFHPLFILQFFIPISPRLLFEIEEEVFAPKQKRRFSR